MACPYCGAVNYKVHSKYSRPLVDLLILGKTVTIHMKSRKFFYPNKECKKRTFAEQPGNEVFRYRRRTRRYEVLVIKQGNKYDSYVENEYRHGKDLRKIYREIMIQGFKGSITPFYEHYKYLCDGHHGHRSAKQVQKMKKTSAHICQILVPIKDISYIVNRSITGKEIKDREKEILIKLLILKWFNSIYKAAASFYTAIPGENLLQITDFGGSVN